MKKCIKCKINKKLDEYSKYSLSKDGLQCWCKSCASKWRKENRERLSILHKKWRCKNINKIKIKTHENYLKNKEKIKLWQKEYRSNFPERKKESDRKSYIKHMDKKKLSALQYQEKNKIDWENFLGTKFICESCGKEIYYNKPELNKPICFDHRHDGKEIISNNPSDWLRKHPRTEENEKIWLSCDFGILCFECNRWVPTRERKKYLMNLNKYVFGKHIYDLLVREMSKLGGSTVYGNNKSF